MGDPLSFAKHCNAAFNFELFKDGNESCRPSMRNYVPHHHHLIASTGIEARGGVGGDDGDVDILDCLSSYGDDIYLCKSHARALTNKRAGQ